MSRYLGWNVFTALAVFSLVLFLYKKSLENDSLCSTLFQAHQCLIGSCVNTPWKPRLTPEQRQHGITYFGGGHRLRRLSLKLLNGQPIKVLLLGGSITAYPVYSYAPLFFSAINSSFPHDSHVFDNKAIGGASSAVFTPCFEHLATPDVDLVILEFAVNDNFSTPYDSQERRAFEQLIRKSLSIASHPAVVLLNYYGWWAAGGDGLTRGLFYPLIEEHFTTLAYEVCRWKRWGAVGHEGILSPLSCVGVLQYYDLPVLSLRVAVWHLMRAGAKGFKARLDLIYIVSWLKFYCNTSQVDKIRKSDERSVVTGEIIPVATLDKDDYFYFDRLHPADSGRETLAELLVGLINHAIDGVNAGNKVNFAGDSLMEKLPVPMIPGNKDRNTSFCAQQEDFQSVIKNHQGFEYRPEKPNATSFQSQKWGWTGLRPGSWAELELDTHSEIHLLSMIALS